MLDATHDTTEAPVERIAERPARGWKNRFRVILPIRNGVSGEIFRPGREFTSSFVWPSHEIAEQKAMQRDDIRLYVCEWLGAFPVETPP